MGYATQCNEPDSDCTSRCAALAESHAVRCCSSAPIDGWTNEKCSNVWHESDAWAGGCQWLKYSAAETFCQSLGGRLCTDVELQRNCAASSGCNYDARLLWTSSSEEAPCRVVR